MRPAKHPPFLACPCITFVLRFVACFSSEEIYARALRIEARQAVASRSREWLGATSVGLSHEEATRRGCHVVGVKVAGRCCITWRPKPREADQKRAKTPMLTSLLWPCWSGSKLGRWASTSGWGREASASPLDRAPSAARRPQTWATLSTLSTPRRRATWVKFRRAEDPRSGKRGRSLAAAQLGLPIHREGRHQPHVRG